MNVKAKLTKPVPERWRRAVELYLAPPWNGMAAALRTVGYSEATALHHANRIFSDPRVRAIIKAHEAERNKRLLAAVRAEEELWRQQWV